MRPKEDVRRGVAVPSNHVTDDSSSKNADASFRCSREELPQKGTLHHPAEPGNRLPNAVRAQPVAREMRGAFFAKTQCRLDALGEAPAILARLPSKSRLHFVALDSQRHYDMLHKFCPADEAC